MSSRGLRSAKKRKSEDVNGVEAASDSMTSQPSKRSKTGIPASTPQGRPKTKQDQPVSTTIKPSEKPQMEAMKSTTNPTQPTTHHPSQTSPQTTLTLTESTGNIFSAPPNTLLIHACNTEGSWGAGIAAAFKSHYPSAYEIYHDHCHMNGGELWKKALLIPPQSDDKHEHFVGCLFTSRSKGRKKDSPAQILGATGPAMRDLMRQVRNLENDEGKKVEEVRMCKINSGLFAVKWEKTKGVLESLEVEEEDFREVKVISREE
ncbi:ADP-ribose 1''-phosphate phosphatase [Pseudocercospora fuligena]|uniref:ADP-ribose 1''-phosphate phosphatase n=1 Tax=Pseudocercospora fuligena TaxID=685502 RepID=A0A8H6R9U9_9PEZI|nr:ADP-ribose 1''-phosphate phosphatase [Pseudocercospora fuligena]